MFLLVCSLDTFHLLFTCQSQACSVSCLQYTALLRQPTLPDSLFWSPLALTDLNKNRDDIFIFSNFFFLSGEQVPSSFYMFELLQGSVKNPQDYISLKYFDQSWTMALKFFFFCRIVRELDTHCKLVGNLILTTLDFS